MTITRFSTGAIRDNALVTNTSFAASDMELIGTVRVGSGGVSSVTFSNIPQEFKHLQIRGIARGASSGVVWVVLRLNGDTGLNYTYHELKGNGSTASSGAAQPADFIYQILYEPANATNVFAAGVIDVLDYSSTLKNKTVRTLGGVDTNGAGNIDFVSGLWRNLSAVNQVQLYMNGQNIGQFSRFSLYGIRG